MSNFRKDEYKKTIEYAKKLLNNNVDMTDIVAKTNLRKEQVKDNMIKKEKELNDKKDKFFTYMKFFICYSLYKVF